MKVFVVGYMGAGKSGLGKDAARRARVSFVDTDCEVELEYGATVAEIFEREGEEYFRRLEREVLERVTAMPGSAVIATGGGLPCRGDAMAFMNRAGRTVYLKFGVEKLLRRLRLGLDRRPKLHGMDAEQLRTYVAATLAEREPFYAQASMVIDCDVLSDSSAADYIVLSIRN